MKSALPLLFAASLALSSLTSAQDSTTDNPLMLERILYNADGELVPTRVSVVDYAEATALYGEGSKRYRHGKGNAATWEDAFAYFLKAAQSGHAEAAFYVGRMYFFGHGTEQNYDLAEHWYQLAGRNGSYRAYNNLGYMEDTGRGREKNPLKAIEYYEKSSEMGFAMASSNLAQCYHSGDKGVPADPEKAFAYLRLALLQWDYWDTDVPNDMADWVLEKPDEQDPVAVELALRLLELMVKKGDRHAARTLAYYYNRQDDEFSRQEAYRYFLFLAKRTDVDGMVHVAAKLDKGDGVERDAEASLNWYRLVLGKAPLNKYANCMIGLAYYKGEAVEQDYPAALKYLRTGLEQGNTGAAEYLGWLHRKGWGCVQDDVQAYAYYLLAGEDNTGPSEDTMANIAAELSPEQLQKAEQLARDFRLQYWDEEED